MFKKIIFFEIKNNGVKIIFLKLVCKYYSYNLLVYFYSSIQVERNLSAYYSSKNINKKEKKVHE